MTQKSALHSATNRRDGYSIDKLSAASVAFIKDQQKVNGAYPASPDFSAYTGYCWFRDGAYIADAMSAAGEIASAELFFDWCAEVLTTRREQILHIVTETLDGRPPAGENMLPARFTFDGKDGDADWWDFQLDGYGTWLWALGEHNARHGRSLERWREAITLTVDYLTCSWERPCYDWWEEHAEYVHVSTLGCVGSGLTSIIGKELLDPSDESHAIGVVEAIRHRIDTDGVQNGHLTKWLGTNAVDASLLALVAPMDFIDPLASTGKTTIYVIDEQLTVNNGVHRYLDDTYYGGGQWPLLSCFMGLAQAAAGNRSRAEELLFWAASTVRGEQELPEQVEDHLLDPQHLQPWIDRWGHSASPLLWSHAMFIRLAVTLGHSTTHNNGVSLPQTIERDN